MVGFNIKTVLNKANQQEAWLLVCSHVPHTYSLVFQNCEQFWEQAVWPILTCAFKCSQLLCGFSILLIKRYGSTS